MHEDMTCPNDTDHDDTCFLIACAVRISSRVSTRVRATISQEARGITYDVGLDAIR